MYIKSAVLYFSKVTNTYVLTVDYRNMRFLEVSRQLENEFSENYRKGQ